MLFYFFLIQCIHSKINKFKKGHFCELTKMVGDNLDNELPELSIIFSSDFLKFTFRELEELHG